MIKLSGGAGQRLFLFGFSRGVYGLGGMTGGIKQHLDVEEDFFRPLSDSI